MFFTPVVYTIDMVPSKWRTFYLCTPIAIVIESFRNIFFGSSCLTRQDILLSCRITLAIAIVGILLFNRVEKNFLDTI